MCKPFWRDKTLDKTKQTKKKDKTMQTKKITIAIVVILLIAYGVFSVYQLIRNPTDVFMIENGKVALEEEAVGYVIREEQVVQGKNYKNGMVPIKAEGQRAAKNEPIFRYYSSGEEELIKKIEELDQKIDEAQASENTTVFPSDIKVLDKEIETKLEEISKLNNLQKIEEYKKSIDKAIAKKTEIIGKNSSSNTMKKLIEERSSYETKLNSGSESITAPESGMVSYKVDGLEKVLTPNDFSTLNKDFLEGLNLKTGQVIATNSESGKIVNNYICYIATILPQEKVHDIKQDSKVTIRLSSSKEVEAKVVFYQEQDENVLAVFQISQAVEELINYRKISFDIIYWSFSGLKVPNSAIIQENNLSYVVRNRAGYLDKILVEVKKNNNTYSIIDSYDTDELKELGFTSSEIRKMKSISLYDEILTHPSS